MKNYIKVTLALAVTLLFLAVVTPVRSFAVTASNRIIFSRTTYSCTTTSGSAVAINKNRKYLLIQNTGATTVYLKLDAAHSGTEGIVIVAGGNYEPVVVPSNAFFCVSASSTDTLEIIQGN